MKNINCDKTASVIMIVLWISFLLRIGVNMKRSFDTKILMCL